MAIPVRRVCLQPLKVLCWQFVFHSTVSTNPNHKLVHCPLNHWPRGIDYRCSLHFSSVYIDQACMCIVWKIDCKAQALLPPLFGQQMPFLDDSFISWYISIKRNPFDTVAPSTGTEVEPGVEQRAVRPEEHPSGSRPNFWR